MPASSEIAGLLAVQRAFAAAVLGGPAAAAPLLDQLRGPPEQSLRRLAAYHRNVVGNRIAALRATYPGLVARLATSDGEAAFDELACRFALSHDGRCGDLNDYGEGFADWLQSTPAAAANPWLPELARLEWEVQTAWSAADCAPFDFAALAAVPAERHGELRFRLAPAFRMRGSPWPLAELWSGVAPASLAPRQQWLWVVRPADLVNVVTVSAAEFAFIAALTTQATLAEAIEKALLTDERFDVGNTLVRVAGLGLLATFTISGESA